MDRLVEKWRKEKRYAPLVAGRDSKTIFKAFENIKNNPEMLLNFPTEEYFHLGRFFQYLMHSCEDLIVDKNETNDYILELILRQIDMKTLDIVVGQALSIEGFDGVIP